MGEEVWRQIPSFPKFLVSDGGRIKNRVTGKILKPSLNQNGDALVRVNTGGAQRTVKLSKLIATAFEKETKQEEERWTEIPEASLYLISTRGRIKNKKTEQFIKTAGVATRPVVSLYLDNGRRTTRGVKTLVRETFGQKH